MRQNLLRKYFLIIVIAASWTGCDDTITNDELDEIVIPDSDVSYSKYIQPLFDLKCTYAGCHDDNTRAGNLSLTSWSNATARPDIVSAGNPETSRLVWAVKGEIVGSPMPPIRYPPLTKNQIEGIITWISEGAKNN